MNEYSETKKTRKSRLSRFLTKSIITIVILVFVLFLMFSIRISWLANKKQENPKFTDEELEMIMFDVGQGDSFLFLQNNEAVLIDTGSLNNWNEIRKNLDEIGVNELKYLIITHPHHDHAGGMFSIFASFKVQNVIIADVPKDGWSESENDFIKLYNLYLKYVNILYGGNLVKFSNNYQDGIKFSDSTIKFIFQEKNSYEKLNNYSIVSKVTFKNTDILLTGDIEKEVEKEFISSNKDLTADIYNSAHHGSRTSNTDQFLDFVNPSFVMISSDNGNDNLYGHPVKRFMRYLENHNIPVYRTDEQGTVIMTTDGENIEFDCSPGGYKSGKEILKERQKQEN